MNEKEKVMLTAMQSCRSTHLSLCAGLGEDRTFSDAALGQGDTGPAMSGDDVLVSATLSPGQRDRDNQRTPRLVMCTCSGLC